MEYPKKNKKALNYEPLIDTTPPDPFFNDDTSMYNDVDKCIFCVTHTGETE